MENFNGLAGARRIARAEHARSCDRGDKTLGEGRRSARGRVLIVEDEAPMGRCLARMIDRCGGTAILVASARAAREQLASGALWTALILDVLLDDASGLHILRDVRRTNADLPAALVTGLLDHDIANAACELDAKYLVKPVEPELVESFFLEAAQKAARASRVPNAVAVWTVRYGLTEAENDILLLAADGNAREAIAAARGSAEATIKNQVHNLLQKTGDESLVAAVARLLREAIHS